MEFLGLQIIFRIKLNLDYKDFIVPDALNDQETSGNIGSRFLAPVSVLLN
jgi:hypothetical protein